MKRLVISMFVFVFIMGSFVSGFNACEELSFEQGQMGHIMDAMLQDQTAEAHDRIIADFIHSAKMILSYYLICHL